MGVSYAYKELEFVPGTIVVTVFGQVGVVTDIVKVKKECDVRIMVRLLDKTNSYDYEVKEVDVWSQHDHGILPSKIAEQVRQIRKEMGLAGR